MIAYASGTERTAKRAADPKNPIAFFKNPEKPIMIMKMIMIMIMIMVVVV